MLRSVARTQKIKTQYQATDGEGTNAGTLSNIGKGIKMVELAIPVRNMHTPVETINSKDLDGSIKLLSGVLINRRLEL